MFLTADEKNCQQQSRFFFYLSGRHCCCSAEKVLSSIQFYVMTVFFPRESIEGAALLILCFILSRYGQKKWLNKSECRNINRTYCDLSAETHDYEHQYYAKVKAIWGRSCSKWAETGRFYPLLESK